MIKHKNILVTGGAGYIGTTLVPMLLGQGYTVRVLDALMYGGQGLLSCYWDIEFIKGSIVNDKIITDAVEGMDVVIHLAAYVGEPLCKEHTTVAQIVNAYSTKMLAKRARQAGVKLFVLASTCSNYGVSQGELATEDAELNPLGIYSLTKITAERVVSELEYNGFRTMILRFATAYGISPRMRLDTMVNEFAYNAFRNKKLSVYAPDAWRPFVHVKDISRFILHIMHPAMAVDGHIYNVGGHNMQKWDLVMELHELVKGLEVERLDAVEDKRDYKVSFEKALGIGFEPHYTPYEGLREVVGMVRDGLIDYPPKYRNV